MNEKDVTLTYGGARGGGKSFFGCLWVMARVKHLINEFGLKPSKNPLPVGFMGRKQGSDFVKTTLETWKRIIPAEAYEIREQAHEIVIEKCAKVYFGGLDNRETVSKFTSAELAFYFIDQAEETDIQDVGHLGGTLRLTYNGIRPAYKVLYTANPAECWLKQMFIPPWGPPKRKTKEEPIKVFVPALPTDNPHLPSGYIDRLEDAYQYDKGLLNAMIRGDWNVLAGFKKLISMSDLTQCFLPEAEQHGYDDKVVISVDSARFGDDKTVILVWKNRNIVDHEVYGKKDFEHTYGRVRYWDDKTDNIGLVVVDEGGQVGGALVDSLRNGIGDRVIGVNFGSKPTDESKYFNKRSELYGQARDYITNRKVGIPRGLFDLHKELTAIEFDYKNDYKLWIRPKDLLKKEMGGSPDWADSFVLGIEGYMHHEYNKEKGVEVEVYNWDSWHANRDFAEQQEAIPETGLYS